MVIRVAVPHQFKLKVVPDLRTLFFPDKRDVHYIGGSDILPAPLDTREETAAINDLGSEDDEQARKLLIEHNLRLVVYIAKKFDNTGVGVEDLISIGAYKSGTNPRLDKAVSKIDRVNEFLMQKINESFSGEESLKMMREIVR